MKTQEEIGKLARSALSIPVAKRIGVLKGESDESRKQRSIARQAREKVILYKNKIMKL